MTKFQQVLALSDERDQWERRIDRAWRDGYDAGRRSRQDDYARGVADGAYARKRAGQDTVEQARLELLRWGPGGREHFGDSRPGDYPGRSGAAA